MRSETTYNETLWITKETDPPGVGSAVPGLPALSPGEGALQAMEEKRGTWQSLGRLREPGG